MIEFDLDTEEGRKREAIRFANLSHWNHIDLGQRVNLRYIDSPPLEVKPLDEPMDINQTINVGLLIYERTYKGWELIEALSYRELMEKRNDNL